MYSVRRGQSVRLLVHTGIIKKLEFILVEVATCHCLIQQRNILPEQAGQASGNR
ncbi:UNVERIFIED_CONTAM: hypothetical protein GTU68_039350 [Idotea baltica]|nr:hypothetical protein [Idotea baltica]